MALMRYQPRSTMSPFNTLSRLQQDLDRLMGTGDLGGLWGENGTSTWMDSDWAPSVDIAERDDRFVIHADVPGVNAKDIEITMDNGVLTIRGERVFKDEEKDEGRYRRVERARGSFIRRFALPETADPDQISARSRDGVLEVEIMKGEKAKPRKIEVKS